MVVLLAVSGWLIYKYAYLVYREYDYYAYYEDIHGLQRSSPVMISGVRVGEVSDIYINGNNKVKVTLSINKKVPVPRGSVALLASKGILGERMILLNTGRGPGNYTHEDVITGMYDTSVMDMKDQIDPMVESVKYMLNTADKNFSSFNRQLDNGLVEQTQANIRSIEGSMKSYQQQVSQIHVSADKVTKSIREFRASTDKIASDTKGLNNSIRNTEASTAEYAQKPMAQQLDTLRNSVSKVNNKATELQDNKTLKKALQNDKDYKEAAKTLQDAHNDMEELRADPPGISLIGGGKKK